MLFNIFIIISGLLLVIGSFYLLYTFKNSKEINNIEPSANYLNAKEIFVRDPEVFKDNDKDGIDDIIDKEIN